MLSTSRWHVPNRRATDPWDFGETSNELGLDQDGAHALNVTFVDAGPGGNPIPLPPAAWAGLLTLGGAGIARWARRSPASARR